MIKKLLSDSQQRWFYWFVHLAAMAAIWIGAVVSWYYPIVTIPQIIGVGWMVNFHLKNHYCPLTKLEKDAMKRAGQEPYKNGYYQNYFFRKLFKYEASDTFTTNYMKVTKVLPGFLPLIYPIIKLIF